MVYRWVLRWRDGVRTAASLGGLVALAACTSGPGRDDQLTVDIARRACERLQECSCAPEAFEGEFALNCADISDDLGDWEPGPYAFDAECGQRALDLLNNSSCDDAVTFSRAEVCPLYFGALLEGAPCGEALRPDNIEDFEPFEQRCGRGLACVRSTCMDVATVPYGSEGFPCEAGGVCDVGLSCRDSTCARLPSAGEPCLDGECADGIRCVGEFMSPDPPMCAALGGVGESCMGHGDCATNNCPAGFCASAAVTGAECGDRLPCGPGLTCSDGVCEPPNSCDVFASLSPDFF